MRKNVVSKSSHFHKKNFNRSFETLPEIKEKFKLFKHLPYDDLSTNHALRYYFLLFLAVYIFLSFFFG